MRIENAWLTYKGTPVEAFADAVYLDAENSSITLDFLPSTAELDAICLNQDYEVISEYANHTVIGGYAKNKKFTPKDFQGNSGYKYNLNAEKYAYFLNNNSDQGTEILFVDNSSDCIGRRKMCLDSAGNIIVTDDLLGKNIRARVGIIYEKLCVVQTGALLDIEAYLVVSDSGSKQKMLETYYCKLDFSNMSGVLGGSTRRVVLKFDENIKIQVLENGYTS